MFTYQDIANIWVDCNLGTQTEHVGSLLNLEWYGNMSDNASLLLSKEASQREAWYFYYGRENLAILIEVH